MIGVEALVAVHHCYEIVRIRQVDDVVGISWKHVHGLDLIAAHFKLNHFIGAELTLLDFAVTATTIKNSHLVLCQCSPFVIPGLEMLMLT